MHVLDFWDWLEHLGLLCLFEQRQLASQILFKRQPCHVELDMYHKYMWPSDVWFAKRNARWCVCCSVSFFFSFKGKFVCTHYIRTCEGILYARYSVFCYSVKYSCVVIFTGLSCNSLMCWNKAKRGITYTVEKWERHCEIVCTLVSVHTVCIFTVYGYI